MVEVENVTNDPYENTEEIKVINIITILYLFFQLFFVILFFDHFKKNYY